MQQPSALCGLSPEDFSLKYFLYFFFKKNRSGKVSYIFSKKTFPIYRKRNFLIISSKKFFLYFRKGIFRTLVYLQLEAYLEPYAYSEHCQKSMMDCSVKHSYLENFPASALKRFPPKKFFIFFLIFFFFF